MNLKKVAIVAILVLSVTSLIFSGGSGQKGSASSTAGAQTGSKELNIYYSGNMQPHEKEFFTDVFVKKFETKYGVKVNVEFVGQSDGIKKIESEQSTGNIIADLIYVDTPWVGFYINPGYMENIKGKSHPGSTITSMFDYLIIRDGAQYFIPTDFDVYILAANVDALKYLPAGVTRQNVIDGITWEQYVDWAINIAKGEGVGKTMMPALNQGSQLLYPMAGMTMAYGGGFPDFTSDGFKKALDLIAKMAAGNAFYPEMAQYSAPTDPMRSRDVWLTFAHMGPIGVAYNAAPNEWVIGAAPKGSKGAGTTAGAWGYGLVKGAKHRDLAETWLDYVTTPEVNYEFCSTMALLSPIKEASSLFSPTDVIMAAGNKMLVDTVISGVPSIDYQDWNAVKLLYHDAFDYVMTNKQVPPDSFLRDLDAKCQALKN